MSYYLGLSYSGPYGDGSTPHKTDRLIASLHRTANQIDQLLLSPALSSLLFFLVLNRSISFFCLRIKSISSTTSSIAADSPSCRRLHRKHAAV
ncbi:unnamed protein product [Cuscuta europaea]|uniref:Uncharacterized protein n=1 Tax=Cuscuta europaea TaxID=41803 RepID=A0A9P0YQF8_CUSEU|nr:unnamed protein product [Cuscuta europaea]